jgi:hypothetical protein
VDIRGKKRERLPYHPASSIKRPPSGTSRFCFLKTGA